MIAPVLSADSAERFPSLSALRATHGELLRRPRESTAGADLLAEIETFLHRGCSTGALIDESEERWEAQSILDYWVTFLFRADRRTVDATLDEFDPQLAPKLPDEACPYVGLDAFRESRFDVFFGRQRMIKGMLDRLASERLLAVVGSSGSGKSSVVLAGVLPALKAGELPGSATWHYLPPLVSGQKPLLHLARALSPRGTAPEIIAAEAARLLDDPQNVLGMAAGEAGRPMVLVVDQFEELFTLCGEEPVRQTFVDVLAALVRSPGLRHTVLLTMRSDYEDNVAKLGSFQPLFESAQVRVMPLSEAELRDAILKPAERVGLKFENGLVDALLHDILGEQAGLPLLQFTLLKLWENRKHNRVTWEAYQSLGGVRLALATSADSFYRSLILEEQVTARRILLRMVSPGEGLEITSSRIRRADLHRTGEDPGRIDRVLRRLVEVHLVRLTPGEIPGSDLFEVAHEALVRNWPTFVEWLKDERSEIAMRSRLESMVREWILLDKRGGLLDEAQLRDAERWLTGDSAPLLGFHPDLPALVKASREAIEEVKRKEEEARQRELVQARQLAEAESRRAELQARSSRIFRTLTVVLVVLFLLAVLVFVRALYSQQTAMVAERKALQAERQIQSAKASLVEIGKQRDRADVALRELQKQRDLNEAAWAAAYEQRQMAENALKNANRQQQLLAQLKLEQVLKEQSDRLEQERTQKTLEERDTALREIERQKQLAQDALARYQTQKEAADRAHALTLEAPPVTNTVASNPVTLPATEPSPNQPGRTLLLGESIGSPQGVAGILCCVVKDDNGQKYLLSLRSVFAGAPGTPLLQPGRFDGGTLERDRVATLVRIGKDERKSGAIAKLYPGVDVDLHIPGIGKIKGKESTVLPGQSVRLIGRSRVVKGTTLYADGKEAVITLTTAARPDETGAPVLARDGELIGLLWRSDGKQSHVLRIKPILDELKVKLVKD